jgi:phosphoglycerate kinase
MRLIETLEYHGRAVFVRVDFNVTVRDDGGVTDDTRIRAALPTLRYLLDAGARTLVLASHRGRPKGIDPALSMAPVAERLATLLGSPVSVLPFDLAEARHLVSAAGSGTVCLLENTRFYTGEEANDPTLASSFASLADVFVEDAFGSVHRAHASTEGIARILPAAAGLLVQREVRALERALDEPERPFTAVLGGAKVSDKARVIQNLLPRVDRLLIGGAMANTFLLAQGVEVGTSLVEPDRVELASGLLRGDGSEKLVLPMDVVVADSVDSTEVASVPVKAIPASSAVYDIGPETARLFASEILGSRTVVWNGPVGVFEREVFAPGTYALAEAVAKCPGYTVVGGGESITALGRSGFSDRVDHISTGGGASLEFLEGRALPGLTVLGYVNA